MKMTTTTTRTTTMLCQKKLGSFLWIVWNVGKFGLPGETKSKEEEFDVRLPESGRTQFLSKDDYKPYESQYYTLITVSLLPLLRVAAADGGGGTVGGGAPSITGAAVDGGGGSSSGGGGGGGGDGADHGNGAGSRRGRNTQFEKSSVAFVSAHVSIMDT
uniref:Uncharacterized protein n=1 Tax=Vespula pensylvanica TaxID=30213 RepID=A0A834NZ14_VESPE|nr:hypothetical protein H0235_009284 [Vespula pensylvanica]